MRSVIIVIKNVCMYVYVPAEPGRAGQVFRLDQFPGLASIMSPAYMGPLGHCNIAKKSRQYVLFINKTVTLHTICG